jgi:serine/threonine protein phosphatase 1
MFKVPFFDTKPVRPRIPDGICVYAVGDVHGRIDLLDRLLARIDADQAERPVARPIEVFLGDYVDRGQDSAGVIDRLISRGGNHETVCLLGNHEDCLLEFFTNPGILTAWSQNGGLTTLLSYGLKPSIQSSSEEQRDLSAALAATMPASHRQFLSELPLSFGCGDYFFVHAGVRPGVPLARQREEDLLWIREEFLRHEGAFEKVIVHGHTPVREPDVRANRINIDTGAYATGRLTCVRLEGDEITFI